MSLKELILEAIAEMYCTTVDAVSKDLSSMPLAEQCLEAFCEAMEDVGY